MGLCEYGARWEVLCGMIFFLLWMAMVGDERGFRGCERRREMGNGVVFEGFMIVSL